jgi:ABC-type multidrug transport system fused ATPase/permease subunit
VLRDVSLVVEPGEKVAILRRPARARPLLTCLQILRSQPGGFCSTGTTAISIWTTARSIGLVFQESFSSATVCIIACGHWATLAQVEQATNRRCLRLSPRLPHGFDTISASGIDLSGGQRQRSPHAPCCSIRHSVARRRSAAIDPHTERDSPRWSRPCGAVPHLSSHRLQRARQCDRVIVLDRGYIPAAPPS